MNENSLDAGELFVSAITMGTDVHEAACGHTCELFGSGRRDSCSRKITTPTVLCEGSTVYMGDFVLRVVTE